MASFVANAAASRRTPVAAASTAGRAAGAWARLTSTHGLLSRARDRAGVQWSSGKVADNGRARDRLIRLAVARARQVKESVAAVLAAAQLLVGADLVEFVAVVGEAVAELRVAQLITHLPSSPHLA